MKFSDAAIPNKILIVWKPRNMRKGWYEIAVPNDVSVVDLQFEGTDMWNMCGRFFTMLQRWRSTGFWCLLIGLLWLITCKCTGSAAWFLFMIDSLKYGSSNISSAISNGDESTVGSDKTLGTWGMTVSDESNSNFVWLLPILF